MTIKSSNETQTQTFLCCAIGDDAAPASLMFTRGEFHDYRGLRLCDSCWNGTHFHRAVGRTGKLQSKVVVDCTGGDCECPCRELLAERKAKIVQVSQRREVEPKSADSQLDLFADTPALAEKEGSASGPPLTDRLKRVSAPSRTPPSNWSTVRTEREAKNTVRTQSELCSVAASTTQG